MTSSALLQIDTVRVVAILSDLLGYELSAAGTYQLTIDKLGSDGPGALFDCLGSHWRRATLLSERIVELGGQPTETGMVWSVVSFLFVGGMTHLDRHAILTALADGEERGLDPYHASVKQLDADFLRLVEQELIPEQYRILQVVRALAHPG